MLAAIVVVVAVVVPLLLRARRRRAWQDDLAAAEHEIAWLARLLIPELRRATALSCGERPFDSLRSLRVVPSEVEGRAKRVEPRRLGVGPQAH